MPKLKSKLNNEQIQCIVRQCLICCHNNPKWPRTQKGQRGHSRQMESSPRQPRQGKQQCRAVGTSLHDLLTQSALAPKKLRTPVLSAQAPFLLKLSSSSPSGSTMASGAVVSKLCFFHRRSNNHQLRLVCTLTKAFFFSGFLFNISQSLLSIHDLVFAGHHF